MPKIAGEWRFNNAEALPLKGVQPARVQFVPAVRPANHQIQPPPIRK